MEMDKKKVLGMLRGRRVGRYLLLSSVEKRRTEGREVLLLYT